MTAVSVVIGIGFEGSPDPAAFETAALGIVRALGTVDATIRGTSHCDEWGEEPALWIAATFEDESQFRLARWSLLLLAAEHEQDAVAFTVAASVDIAETADVARHALPSIASALQGGDVA